MFIYCNTTDSPNIVGDKICRANSSSERQSWKVNDEGEFCTISVNSKANCVAVVYSVSHLIVGIEIDDNCAAKIIEPLLENYGFENVKWAS